MSIPSKMLEPGTSEHAYVSSTLRLLDTADQDMARQSLRQVIPIVSNPDLMDGVGMDSVAGVVRTAATYRPFRENLSKSFGRDVTSTEVEGQLLGELSEAITGRDLASAMDESSYEEARMQGDRLASMFSSYGASADDQARILGNARAGDVSEFTSVYENYYF